MGAVTARGDARRATARRVITVVGAVVVAWAVAVASVRMVSGEVARSVDWWLVAGLWAGQTMLWRATLAPERVGAPSP